MRATTSSTFSTVQHDFGGRIALEFDDHAYAVAVAFVLNVGDALDLLFLGEFGDPGLQIRLVHLIGNLVDDDGPAVLADFLDMRAGAHDDGAAPLLIRLARAALPEDQRAGRKVRAGDELHQVGGFEIGILDQGECRINDFTEVMRRDIRRHADGDARRAVDQNIRIARGQDGRLDVLTVVVRLKIDGVAVQIGENGGRNLRHAHFGITLRGGGIAVHRAEVPLPVQQHDGHREILRHPHQRVIDRRLAMRMVFTDHIPDDAGGFAVGLVPLVTRLIHRVENAAVDGLQAIAQIGNRAADDHAHRVVEIAALHLLLDGDRRAVEYGALRFFYGYVVVVVAQGGHRHCRNVFTFRSYSYDAGATGAMTACAKWS